MIAMRHSLCVGAALLLTLSGCSVPEARLRAGLVRAGLSKPLAGCMAGRMAERLSLKQMMRIGDLPRAASSRSLEQFFHRVRALGDPEILRVTTSAAALCAAGLAG